LKGFVRVPENRWLDEISQLANFRKIACEKAFGSARAPQRWQQQALDPVQTQGHGRQPGGHWHQASGEKASLTGNTLRLLPRKQDEERDAPRLDLDLHEPFYLATPQGSLNSAARQPGHPWGSADVAWAQLGMSLE
jgi:hypothetical protein